MPTIRSRRGRSRREPSSDRIEEGPTQDETQEDVDENNNVSEEEQPRRRGSAQQKASKKNKKENARRSMRTQEEEVNEKGEGEGEGEGERKDEDEEGAKEEEDEGAWLDLENFKNQPLSRAGDGHVIANMAKDWDRFAGNWERSAMTMAPQVAEAMAEVGQGRGNEKDQVISYFRLIHNKIND